VKVKAIAGMDLMIPRKAWKVISMVTIV